jgi:hypothetical protein
MLAVIEDNMQESCDVLDDCYSQIGDILNTPLLHDSPEIRNVLQKITVAQDAILYVANNVASGRQASDKEE